MEAGRIGLSDGVGLDLVPEDAANLFCTGTTGASIIGCEMMRSLSFTSSFLW